MTCVIRLFKLLWFVMIINCLPRKYRLHVYTACAMAYDSLMQLDALVKRVFNFLLK